MKSLTSEQILRKNELIAKLYEAGKKVEEVIASVNEALAESLRSIEAPLASYNELVAEANSFMGEVFEETEDYFLDKSEKWQESSVGQDYLQWIEQFQEIIEEAVVEEPEEIVCPECDGTTILENLSERA